LNTDICYPQKYQHAIYTGLYFWTVHISLHMQNYVAVIQNMASLSVLIIASPLTFWPGLVLPLTSGGFRGWTAPSSRPCFACSSQKCYCPTKSWITSYGKFLCCYL